MSRSAKRSSVSIVSRSAAGATTPCGCATCGCSDDTGTRVTDPDHVHDHDHTHDHDHDHTHDHAHDHDHAHTHTVSFEEDVLAKNALLAERNRGWFAGRGIVALNLMGSGIWGIGV